jgi:hypothetical protein
MDYDRIELFLFALVIVIGMEVALFSMKRFWRTRERVPKDFDTWQEELEHAGSHALRMSLEYSRAVARVVELVGKIPADFNPSAFLVCQMVEGIHKAVLIKAAEEGLIHPDALQRVYGGALGNDYAPSSSTSAAIQVPTGSRYITGTVEPDPAPPGAGFVWRGGKLTPEKPS